MRLGVTGIVFFWLVAPSPVESAAHALKCWSNMSNKRQAMSDVADVAEADSDKEHGAALALLDQEEEKKCPKRQICGEVQLYLKV